MSPRKRWMLQPLSWRRGGAVALAVLILVAGAALVLDSGSSGEFGAVVDRLQDSGVEPISLIEDMAGGAQILILGDVHGRAAPKRLAAETIRRLAEGPGLDAVMLEVPASEQRYIEAYMTGAEDNAAMLMSRGAAVQERYGLASEYVQVYQAVREANAGLNPSQRIRIIAGDVDDWPPPEGAGPREIARIYAGRAEHMLNRLDQELFRIMPDARVLIFVDGYQAMQGTSGSLHFGGGDPVDVEWLGEMLRRRSGSRARSILLDAGGPTSGVQRLPTYHGTSLHRALRRELESSTGARITRDLAEVQNVVLELSMPGFSLDILPAGYRLGSVAQGYIFIPGGR